MTNDRSMTPSPIPSLKGRAFTDDEKKDAVEALLAAWLKTPHLRLGQLLVCATDNDLFYVEDSTLVDVAAEFADKISGR